jgi:hypothetical protein
MTIEEAKKLGFRNYDPAIKAVPAWNGNDELHMVGVMRLDPTIHFPTRAKLRAENKRLAALEKSNRMDAAIARQNARVEARKSKDEEFSGFKYVGFSGTEAGSVDLYEAFLLDGTKTTVSDAELSANRDKYFPSAEAARLARLAEYRKSPDPITMEQAKDLRDGDEFFYLQAGGGAPRYHVTRDKLDRRPDITKWKCFTEGRAYWTREAAGAALAKQAKQAKQEKPCDMPEKMELNGVKCHRLSDDEQHKDVDIPVDGSQTHRFGSVWYRPVASHKTPIRGTQAPLTSTDETQRVFPTGAIRDGDSGKPRMDLIPPEALISLGHVLAAGAKHYGEHNWEKGIPLSQFLASMMRHYVAVQMGDHSEDHDAKMLWNAMAFVATAARIKEGKLPVELDDIGWTKEGK